MANETNKDDFFPRSFIKVYPPATQEAETDEKVKREFILQHNRELALVKHSKSEGHYILGTIIVKDDKCYELKPIDASNPLINSEYGDLEELIVRTER